MLISQSYPPSLSPSAFHDDVVTDVKRGLGPTLFNENGRRAHLECPVFDSSEV